MPMMLLEVFIIPQIILKMLGESPPHFLPELTPDDFGLNRWVSCSCYMAVLNHSKYRKLSSPLQNTRVVQGMFTAAAWMTEPQEAVASSHLALPTKAAHKMCCAHMPCRYLAPFLTYHAGCPSSSTTYTHASTQTFSTHGSFDQGQLYHCKCPGHMLCKCMEICK